ncbi:virion structural protein [Pseudomonas phage Phabio]|uniref:Virion structural protein n=1 Tax=Pseudomonas phage Phabio TaxID=2006668 RepID=A0A1Y0SU40_9CAUD|nr:virion structural protein [Pseudomonas phage Phabio]ARV77012.1 virion structural protein [Pseudomonas phage Phabio]
MSIPTLAELTEKVGNLEIAGIETAITARLETVGTVAFLNDPTVTDKTLNLDFDGVHLSESAIALLVASLTKSGWASPVVKNTQGPAYTGIGHQPRPRNNPVLTVSFKPGAVTPPATDDGE